MRPFQCCGRLLLGLLCGPVATALNVINIAGINGDGSLVRVGGGFVAVEWEDAMGSVSMFLVGSGLGADVDSIWQNQGDVVSPYFWNPTEPLAGKSFYLQFSDLSDDPPFNTSTFTVISRNAATTGSSTPTALPTEAGVQASISAIFNQPQALTMPAPVATLIIGGETLSTPQVTAVTTGGATLPASSTSPTSSTPPASSNPATVQDGKASASPGSKLSHPAKIAIAVCCSILGLALLAALGYYLRRKRRAGPRMAEKMMPMPTPYQSAMKHPLAEGQQEVRSELEAPMLTPPSELSARMLHHELAEGQGLVAGSRETPMTRDVVPSQQWTFLRESSATDSTE